MAQQGARTQVSKGHTGGESDATGTTLPHARLTRGLIIGFLVAGALSGIPSGLPILGMLFAGLVVGFSCQGLIPAVACSATSLGAVAVLLALPGDERIAPAMLALSVLAGVGAAAAAALISARATPALAFHVLLGLLVTCFVGYATVRAQPAVDYFAEEPAAEQYAFDGAIFAKVFYLQESGAGFYEAFGESFVQDQRFDAPMPDLAGWRSPIVSSLWSIVFSSWAQLVYAFIVLSAVTMAVAYYLGLKTGGEGSALIGPALLFPYYLFSLERGWFTEYEFWASFAVLASAALLFAKKKWPAVALAAVGGAMREWLLSGVAALFVHSAARRKWRETAIVGVVAVAVVSTYLVNMILVRRYLEGAGISPGLGTAGRFGGGGPLFILYTLRFCADRFAHPLVIAYSAFFIGLAGAVVRIRKADYFMPTLLLLPLGAFMVFGSGQVPGGPEGWNDYYSAAFMPVAFILAGSAWRLMQPVSDTQEVR